jgi:small conductance mechanosensitive channel
VKCPRPRRASSPASSPGRWRRSLWSKNEIELVQDVGRRLEAAWDNLRQRFYGLIGALPLLGVAALVLDLFWYVGRAVAGMSWPYRRIDNAFLRETAQQLVRIAVLLAGVLLALEILDATALVAALLGTAGLFGLVLGFAFRDLVENAIASLLLSLRQPFAPNDLVSIEGRCGSPRATVLLTIEGNHVRYRIRLRQEGERAEGAAPAPEVPEPDVAHRHVVERPVDAERASENADLLDPAAPREL